MGRGYEQKRAVLRQEGAGLWLGGVGLRQEGAGLWLNGAGLRQEGGLW